jgi:hypothetical protein
LHILLLSEKSQEPDFSPDTKSFISYRGRVALFFSVLPVLPILIWSFFRNKYQIATKFTKRANKKDVLSKYRKLKMIKDEIDIDFVLFTFLLNLFMER